MEIYRNEKQNLHRDDNLPAVVTEDLLNYCVNGRLHRSNGPAVITPNGTRMYYWKGVQIDSETWANKDRMAAHEILGIENIEVRRAVIEMVGYEAFLEKANAKAVDTDKDTGAILYRVEMPFDDEAEPLVVVRVKDGTTLYDENGEAYRKQYFLRVPPNMTACKDAIAWTFKMTPEQYGKVEKET
jgi:hypothetical protein